MAILLPSIIAMDRIGIYCASIFVADIHHGFGVHWSTLRHRILGLQVVWVIAGVAGGARAPSPEKQGKDEKKPESCDIL